MVRQYVPRCAFHGLSTKAQPVAEGVPCAMCEGRNMGQNERSPGGRPEYTARSTRRPDYSALSLATVTRPSSLQEYPQFTPIAPPPPPVMPPPPPMASLQPPDPHRSQIQTSAGYTYQTAFQLVDMQALTRALNEKLTPLLVRYGEQVVERGVAHYREVRVQADAAHRSEMTNIFVDVQSNFIHVLHDLNSRMTRMEVAIDQLIALQSAGPAVAGPPSRAPGSVQSAIGRQPVDTHEYRWSQVGGEGLGR